MFFDTAIKSKIVASMIMIKYTVGAMKWLVGLYFIISIENAIADDSPLNMYDSQCKSYKITSFSISMERYGIKINFSHFFIFY